MPIKLILGVPQLLFSSNKEQICKNLLIILIRLLIIFAGSYILLTITNPSVIYHSLRGQALFKITMVKAVNEIIDLILKGYGLGVIDNFSRAMAQSPLSLSQSSLLDKAAATLGLLIYSIIHSGIMLLEMFTLHVILTSSQTDLVSFLFYNQFTEIKISVFKKANIDALYQYAINDGTERL